MGTPPAPRVTGIRTVFANEGAVAAATSAAVSSTLFMGPSSALESRGRAASSEGGFLEEGSSPWPPLKTKLRGPIRRSERDCQPGRKTHAIRAAPCDRLRGAPRDRERGARSTQPGRRTGAIRLGAPRACGRAGRDPLPDPRSGGVRSRFRGGTLRRNRETALAAPP